MKKMIKKIISILCIISTMMCLCISGYATEASPTLSVGDVTAAPGASVDVPISIEGNTGILGATITISYTDGLELTNVQNGTAFSSLAFTKPGNFSANPFNIVWDGTEENDENGSIAILTFKVPKTEGTYNVTLSYKEKGGIINGDMEDVTAAIKNGTVTVKGASADTPKVEGAIDAPKDSKPIKVQLLQGEKSKFEDELSGEAPASGESKDSSFAFESVPDGEYTLKITKKGYAPWIETVQVSGGSASIDKITLYEWGDANRDGDVNASDAQQVQRFVAGLTSTYKTENKKSYWVLRSDANGDGKITAADAQEIQRHAAGLPSTIDNLD